MNPLPETLEEFQECGLVISADASCSTPRKTPFYYSPDDKLNRSIVASILAEYVARRESVSFPVKCIDVIGSAGTSGLLWKKYLAENVDVLINDFHPEAAQLIRENASRNGLSVTVSSTDPCIVLYERGYNFIYLDCSNDAAIYFDSAFRNLSRNGILAITCKDDCSMHGNTPDVALRRYAGRITRTFYYQELGIRLVLAAMARSAAKFNKSLSVICSFMQKGSFTIAVKSQKGPAYANKTLEYLRKIKHCMVCEARVFYPLSDGFPIDPNSIKLGCECGLKAPGNTSLELGPVWSASIFNTDFISGMLKQQICEDDLDLKSTLQLLLHEAECTGKDSTSEKSVKRLKLDETWHPPFYYNIHKHHPQLSQLMKLNKVIEALKEAGFRASKTHFDRLAVRTDAPVSKLHEIMERLDKRS